MTLSLVVLFLASIWAGAQNALAGGGSFITLPSLMLTGMDARAANITSCVALFPSQLVMGVTGRPTRGARPASRSRPCSSSASSAARSARPSCSRPRRRCSPGSCPGSCCSRPSCSPGAASSASRRSPARPPSSALGRGDRPVLIAIYGGYFGGGIGLLMMASLTMAGLAVRNAGATKNVLAGVMNASAVAIFVFFRTCTGCRPRSPRSAPRSAAGRAR